MENKFDSANYPDAEPEELVSGSRWAWTRSDITAVYPTATYTLKYRFSQQDSTHGQWEITAGKVSAAHVVEVPIATTANYPAGAFKWRAVIVRDSDSEEVTADEGFLNILPAFDEQTDTSSWVYRTLVAIRATLEGTASKEQAGYSIGGRSLSLRSPQELLDLEREFKKRWSAEQAEALRKSGKVVKSRVLVTMRA